MIRRLLVSGAAVLAVTGCGDNTGAAGAGDSAEGPPAPGDYVATQLPDPFGARDTMRLTVRDGEVSAQAACNTLGGTADWSGGVLSVTNLAGTEMGCAGDGHAQDEWLVDFLTASPAYDVAGDSFTLTRGDDRIRLEPADEAGSPDGSADAPLVGTHWRLAGIEETDGDSVSLRTVDEPRSGLRIQDGGIAFGTTCNFAGGKATVTADRLRLRQVTVTLRGCLDDRGRSEHDVMRVMHGWVDWHVDGDRLRLTRGDLSLVYRAR
jgi:heat shock protein HslJ